MTGNWPTQLQPPPSADNDAISPKFEASTPRAGMDPLIVLFTALSQQPLGSRPSYLYPIHRLCPVVILHHRGYPIEARTGRHRPTSPRSDGPFLLAIRGLHQLMRHPTIQCSGLERRSPLCPMCRLGVPQRLCTSPLGRLRVLWAQSDVIVLVLLSLYRTIGYPIPGAVDTVSHRNCRVVALQCVLDPCSGPYLRCPIGAIPHTSHLRVTMTPCGQVP